MLARLISPCNARQNLRSGMSRKSEKCTKHAQRPDGSFSVSSGRMRRSMLNSSSTNGIFKTPEKTRQFSEGQEHRKELSPVQAGVFYHIDSRQCLSYTYF